MVDGLIPAPLEGQNVKARLLRSKHLCPKKITSICWITWTKKDFLFIRLEDVLFTIISNISWIFTGTYKLKKKENHNKIDVNNLKQFENLFSNFQGSLSFKMSGFDVIGNIHNIAKKSNDWIVTTIFIYFWRYYRGSGFFYV